MGRRLASGTATAADQALYVEMLDAYDRAQLATRIAVEHVDWHGAFGMRFDVTGRTKTRDTLVQKLQRSPEIQLPYVRDIAGVRIVADFTLLHQRVLVELLRRVFDCDTEPVIDRIAQPVSGYRALHAVVRVDGIPVEVQVRTGLQHLWAEVYERLADQWGRQIRYGGAPDSHSQDVVAGVTQAGVIATLQKASIELIAVHEKNEDTLFQRRAVVAPGLVGEQIRTQLGLAEAEPTAVEAILEETEAIAAELQQQHDQLAERLLDLARVIDDAPPEDDPLE